jgi:hypothetical protein
MIQAAISIRVRSNIYRYVRDETADTFGVGTQYYGYRGNARRKLNLSSYNNSVFRQDTGLQRGVSYSLNVAVNGESAEEIFIKFGQIMNDNNKVTYEDLYNKLNKFKSLFTFEWDDVDRDNEGFYFVAPGNTASTTIAVTSGTTGTDLLASLKDFVDIGSLIPSDNFQDQTGAGKILGDLTNITDQITAGENTFLEFPETTPTDFLLRESHEKTGNIYTQVVLSHIDGVHVYETKQKVRNNF